MPVSWMHAFVDVPQHSVDTAQTFWAAVTGWAPSAAWDAHPEFVSLEPSDGTAYVHVQSIDGAPRVHLDLFGDPVRDTARLAGLGAVPGHRADWWQVLTSPGGLPFCVCEQMRPHRRPDAVTWPDGHRSRLVQLCVDVPADRYETEWAFWAAATGWAEEPVGAPEFRRLVHREQSPMQLLVQRLGDHEGTARAHLDLGTDDIGAEVARVQALGAQVLSSSDGLTVLRDPVGLPFCVTGNEPALG